jgi:hypothetical protein
MGQSKWPTAKKNRIWKAAHLMNRRGDFYFGVEKIKRIKCFASEFGRRMTYFLRWQRGKYTRSMP